MKETMRTYSECLVHHLGPQALWRRDFIQWLTPSLPSPRSHTPNPGAFSLSFSRLIQKEIICLIFSSALREICVMWFQGNNSDHSRIYSCVPFSLFTHVSSSPFLPLFLLPTPLPTPPQESNTFPLSSACFALAPLQGGKGCFPLQMRSGLHPKSGLAFTLVMSYSRGISSVRGLGGICHYNIPVPLFGTLSVTLSPFLGWNLLLLLSLYLKASVKQWCPEKCPDSFVSQGIWAQAYLFVWRMASQLLQDILPAIAMTYAMSAPLRSLTGRSALCFFDLFLS